MMITAIVCDLAIPYIVAPFCNGYSHKIHVMSSLGNPNSRVRVVYNTWLILFGILLLISSKLIFIKFGYVSKPLSVTIVILISIFAIGAGILSGIFCVDDKKAFINLSSKIHGVGASVGFVMLLFMPLLLGLLFFKAANMFAGVICIVCFICAFAFFILFIMADKPLFQGTAVALEGLWQRATLLFMYIPLACIAILELSTK